MNAGLYSGILKALLHLGCGVVFRPKINGSSYSKDNTDEILLIFVIKKGAYHLRLKFKVTVMSMLCSGLVKALT